MNKYTGNAGYQNSLTQAGKGAAVESESAGAQAQSQARQAGMSKAQAAAMGANNASEQYGKSFTDQQAKAADQGNTAVDAQSTNVSNASTEYQNKYNRAWGNVGNSAGIAGSLVGGIVRSAAACDENLKDYYKLSDRYSSRRKLNDISKILSDERTKRAVKLTSTSEEQSGNAIAANSGYRPSGYSLDKDTGLHKEKKGRSLDEIGKDIQESSNLHIKSPEYIAPKTTKLSDMNAKNMIRDNSTVNAMSNIDSYIFRYKPEAQKLYKGRSGVDNDVHVGVMAQDLEKNPVTASTVSTDPVTGYKQIDTGELTLANTAVISDLAKEIKENK